jgi:hypothetical protein
VTRAKPIYCLDFDGVIHSYLSGWKGADVIPDSATPGAIFHIVEAQSHFDVQIFSSRSHQEGGIAAMRAWLMTEYGKAYPTETGREAADWVMGITFPKEKPPAMVSLDDRCLTFNGPETWPTMATLLNFKPWNKR